MNKINIITINTWKCDGNYDKRIVLLAQQLKALQPAIIACQECFASNEGNADTLQYLASELGMQACFLPGRFRKRIFRGNWVESFSGLGILSAYPLNELEHFSLPEVPGDEQRYLQLAEAVVADDVKILIANTHLTHLRNPELRKEQAAFAAEKVSSLDAYKYRIICGDMNAEMKSVDIRPFSVIAKAVDCYVTGGGEEPRYSLAEAYNRGMNICVDHIFALPYPGSDTYPDFVNSSVVLNEKDKESGIYPSDHFGITTTMVID